MSTHHVPLNILLLHRPSRSLVRPIPNPADPRAPVHPHLSLTSSSHSLTTSTIVAIVEGIVLPIHYTRLLPLSWKAQLPGHLQAGEPLGGPCHRFSRIKSSRFIQDQARVLGWNVNFIKSSRTNMDFLLCRVYKHWFGRDCSLSLCIR